MSAIVSTKAAGGTVKVTASFANAAAAGTVVACDLEWSPTIGKQKEIIIPTSEYWLFTDLYTNNAAGAGTDVNPEIEFYKDADRILDRSQPLNTVIVTSAQRPNGLHGNLQYEGGTHMSAKAVSSVLAAAARTILAIAPFEKRG